MKRGFTLLELLVVLAVMAMVVSMVAMKWSTPLKRAKFSECIRKIESIDRQSRLHAVATGQSIEVKVDIEQNQLVYDRYFQGNRIKRVYSLPNEVEIKGLKTLGDANSQAYKINSNGMSETIQIEIACLTQRRFLSVIGGTGQVSTLKQPSELFRK